MKIAYDLDGVLCDTNAAFIRYMNDNGQPDWNVKDVDRFEYWETFGVTPEYIAEHFERFFNQKGSDLPLIPKAQSAINTLSTEGNDIYIISSRMPQQQRMSHDWARKYFGEFIQGVHCLGSHADKGEVCKALGIEILLDDRPKHVTEAHSAGLHGVLFDQQYNREAVLPRILDHHNFRKHIERLQAEYAKSKL